MTLHIFRIYIAFFKQIDSNTKIVTVKTFNFCRNIIIDSVFDLMKPILYNC